MAMMRDCLRAALPIAALLALVASGAAAKDTPCTDGVDCLCDRLANPADPLYDPNVVFCEDFEDPRLNNGDQLVPGVDGPADGWADKYGPPSNGCLDASQPAGQGLRDEGAEGTHPWSCFNIVQEGACEVGSDCVFDGTSSLGHRMRPGATQGIFGRASLTRPATNFGLTMVWKLSDNYVTPKERADRVAQKSNEFGAYDHCILGCSVNNAGNPDYPFAATLKPFSRNPGGRALMGNLEWDGSAGLRFGPTQSDYDFERDWGKGRWACVQMQWTGWGTSNASAKYWINGRPVLELAGIDMTALAGNRDAGGLRGFAFNNYYNNGYPGPSIAYRLEDNIVIRDGPPASCATIGFDSANATIDAPLEPSDEGNSPPPAEEPPPAEPPGLTVSALLDFEGGVSANLTGGMGPYQVLVDCQNDGSWDLIWDSNATTYSGTCPSPVSSAKVWAWDKGAGTTTFVTVVPGDSASIPVGPPGRPVLLQ